MGLWNEIKDIRLDLSELTDEVVKDMLKTMTPAEKQKIIDDLKKETQENKNLTRSMQLALRLASMILATL